jgi:hypothetical protein
VCGFELLSDYILDERPSPEAIVGMFARAYRGDARRPDRPLSIILLAGMLARGDETGPELDLVNDMLGDQAITMSRVRAEAQRIVTEYAGDIEAFAELLDRLDAIDAELRPAPIVGEGDVDFCGSVVEHGDHHVAA